MKTDSDRKNRTVPFWCIALFLTSVLIPMIIAPVYSIVERVAYYIPYVIRRGYSIPELLPRILESILRNNPNVSFFSLLFILIIAVMLIFKMKGGFVAIPAFLAYFFTSISGIIRVLYQLQIYASWDPDNRPLRFIFSELLSPQNSYCLSNLLYFIRIFLQLLIPIFWFVLGLAAIVSIFSRNAKKKAFKPLFDVFTLFLGVWSGGIFITTILTNVLFILSVLNDIIYDIIHSSITIWNISDFTHFFFTPILIFASTLGLAGIILLAIYLVNPYEREKKLTAEAIGEAAEIGAEESYEICEAEVPVRVDHEDESNKSDIEKISPSNQQPKLQKQSRRKFAKYAKRRPMAKVIHPGKYTHI